MKPHEWDQSEAAAISIAAQWAAMYNKLIEQKVPEKTAHAIMCNWTMPQRPEVKGSTDEDS